MRTPSVDELRARVDAAGQEHLFAFDDRLDDSGRARLHARLGAIDWDRVPAWAELALSNTPDHDAGGPIEPAPYYPADEHTPGSTWDRAAYRAAGEELIAAGKVAAFTVAGGQGTRLGFDGPKGCFPGGAVTKKPLFACLAEGVLAASRRFGVTVPWCVMTSPLNHDATVAFFREHRWMGLGEENVIVFNQGVLPSFDLATGRVLLAAPDEPATNPDGHGGSLRALAAGGALDELERRGVEHISYTQIDNPLVRVIDPVFLGLHATAPDSSAEMSSKMIAKTDPAEKVGLFCRRGGALGMIEYSDLDPALAQERGPGGRLRFNAGNPAIHALGLGFVRRLNNAPGGFALPLHRAVKKIPCVNPDTGEPVHPDEPNGVKLETFVFDALPMASKPLVLETLRVEEFAPIKNASGSDSAESSAALTTERAAAWLETAGVTVPRRPDGTPDCTLEIGPLTATEPADLIGRDDLPPEIAPGAQLAF